MVAEGHHIQVIVAVVMVAVTVAEADLVLLAILNIEVLPNLSIDAYRS